MDRRINSAKETSMRPTLLVIVHTLLASAFLLVGCGVPPVITDSTTAAVNVLDDAADRLANESAAWQQVLNDTISRLTDSAQSTVRNEVSNLLSRTVATTGAQFRCDA